MLENEASSFKFHRILTALAIGEEGFLYFRSNAVSEHSTRMSNMVKLRPYNASFTRTASSLFARKFITSRRIDLESGKIYNSLRNLNFAVGGP